MRMNDKEAREINIKYAWRQLELAVEDVFYSSLRKQFEETIEEVRSFNVPDTEIRKFLITTWFGLEEEKEQ